MARKYKNIEKSLDPCIDCLKVRQLKERIAFLEFKLLENEKESLNNIKSTNETIGNALKSMLNITNAYEDKEQKKIDDMCDTLFAEYWEDN